MKYTCIDSFCGAGGLSLGLKKAGFDILLGFDNDEKCIKTQNANRKYFNHPVLLADAEEMLQGKILQIAGLKRGELFLFAGGPPCQGFSIQRIGPDEDYRNELILKYMVMVEILMPKYYLMENVSGMRGKRGRAVLAKALKKAEEVGYWVHVSCLDAQDYGVPQRRKRVFVIGERVDQGPPSFQFPLPTTPPNQRITVRMAIGHLPPPPEDWTDHPLFPLHRKDKLSEINIQRLKALKPGQGREHLPEHLLADCHKVDCAVIGHRNVYGRMSWDDVAPTITARFDSFTRGMFGHPEQDRSISLREGAILQTFPPDFIFKGNKVEIAKQIGNAVPPLLAETIGKQIILCDKSKSKPSEGNK